MILLKNDEIEIAACHSESRLWRDEESPDITSALYNEISPVGRNDKIL